MSTGPKDGWGGKRDGSGRKNRWSVTETQVKEMLRDARKRAKLEGKKIDDILLDIIYARSGGAPAHVETKDRLAAIKIFKEYSMGKHSEQNVTFQKIEGPKIFLPEMRPDPAKVKMLPEGNA